MKPTQAKEPKQPVPEALMRLISKRAGGGDVSVKMTTGGFYAHVFPTSSQAREAAQKRIAASGKTTIGIHDYQAEYEIQSRIALHFGVGKTIATALADLYNKFPIESRSPQRAKRKEAAS